MVAEKRAPRAEVERAGAAPRVLDTLPGLGVVLLIAIAATAIGWVAPVLGGPVSAVVIGVLLAATLGKRTTLRPGIRFASGTVLQLAVVVLGSQLSLSQVAHVGLSSLPIMLVTLSVCLLLAALLGYRMGIAPKLRTLIGVGTGICGASAIAAVTPVVEAASLEVGYAISTIFLFNIAAVLLFPLVGHLLGMSQHAFGLFAGTAVNDTSSVVAAATSYGNQATNYAVVVKLTRSLMIIPICLGLAGWAARRERRAEGTRAAQSTGSDAPAGDGGGSRVRIGKLVPWFLVGFVLVAAINSLGLIPQAAHGALTGTASFLITIALAGIGLSIDIRGLRRTGPRPLLLGALLWIAVSTTSLGMQWLLGVHG